MYTYTIEYIYTFYSILLYNGIYNDNSLMWMYCGQHYLYSCDISLSDHSDDLDHDRMTFTTSYTVRIF